MPFYSVSVCWLTHTTSQRNRQVRLWKVPEAHLVTVRLWVLSRFILGTRRCLDGLVCLVSLPFNINR